MDKTLKIYELVNNVETPFPNSTLQAELYSFQYDCKRMGNAPTITGTIMYPLCLDNLWNDKVFVKFNNERYFINHIPSSSYSNADTRYKHEITFVSERKILENIIFTDGIETEFHFFGDLKMFVDRLNAFLTSRSLGYNIVLDDNFITDEKDVDIQGLYVNEVLNKGFELFNIPYYYDGKTIHFGYYQTEISQVFEYGVDNALLSVNKENSNDKVITRITGVGSSDNIPYYYPNFNESGEHDVTTTPSGYQTQISKLNYLKIDPYTNLRNGGWAKYHKACVNPIGDDTDDVSIQINNGSLIQEYKTDWNGNFTIPSYPSYELTDTHEIVISITPKLQNQDIEINSIVSSIAKSSQVGEEDFVTNDITCEVISVIGLRGYQQVGVPYSQNNGVISFNSDVLNKIIFRLKCTFKKQVPLRYDDWYVEYSYDTKYSASSRNTTVKSTDGTIDEKVYLDFNKVIDFFSGTNSFRKQIFYTITREVAGYSSCYFDCSFKAVFIDNNGDDMSEWNIYSAKPTALVDSDGNNYTDKIWYNETSRYAHFRNTSSSSKIITATMVALVIMDTEETAYGVELEYIPDFGRNELPYDYWRFHDGKEIKYDICGIKFANKDTIPDSLNVNFSATKNWIDPKPNLMPSVFRNTRGANIWYNAINNRYTDEHGSYITFENEYDPNNPKEHISDPKNDIKPTIVGVTNTDGERIDQIYKIYFNPNDNNNEWITDDSGNNQELKHSFFFVKLRKMDFNLFDHALEKGEMTISMTSGLCGGCNFTIMVDEETQKNTVQVDENGSLLTDAEGNVIFGAPIERQQDTSQNEVWIALRKEEDSYGVIMPDFQANLVPVVGDTFVFTNILLPNEYIKKAERKLDQELLKDLKENNTDKFNFSINFSRIFFAENPTILSELNENSKITVLYNGINNVLYVNSYSYKMDNDKPLPEIKVELKDILDIITNTIQKSINKVEIKFSQTISKLSKETQSKTRGGGGGNTNISTDINIVQTTGTSTTSVMSQKAVTIELAKIPEISQNLGNDTNKTISQKTITEELRKAADNKVVVTQSMGDSTTLVMSQNTTTNAINNIIPKFHSFENVDITDIVQGGIESSNNGSIVFATISNRTLNFSVKTFLYKVNTKYYTSWDTSWLMCSTEIFDEEYYPYFIPFYKLYECNNAQYFYDGTNLVPIEKKEIPHFYGIVDSASVTNGTGFNRNGKVYFIKNARIGTNQPPQSLFAYKIRETYYTSWNSVQDYMKSDLSSPLEDKLFLYDNKQYIYNEGKLSLLSNVGKTIWENF